MIDRIRNRHSIRNDNIVVSRPLLYPSSAHRAGGYVLRNRAQASQESDVCPGCLIQRFQKYSVGEAATTQPPPPLATTAGCSSPATSFTQFPPSTRLAPSRSISPQVLHASMCSELSVPRDRHIPIRGRGGPMYIFISRRLSSRMDEKGIDTSYPREISSLVATKARPLLYIYRLQRGTWCFRLCLKK